MARNKWLVKAGLGSLAGGAVAGGFTLGMAHYLVDQLTRLRPLTSNDYYTFTPFETQVDYEDVSFPTVNGRLLKGWWLPRPQSQRVVIAVSGYRGKKEDMLGISSILWRNGYNVLLFDYRAYGAGRLADEMFTLGHRELEDVQSAVRYVRSRLERPWLGLLGGSMGASVVLMATARDPEIKAVWADSAFASQEDVIAYGWRSATHLPGRPVVDVAARLFERRTGHRWQDFAPIAEIGRIAPRPVYLVHAVGDRVIPVEQVHRLYEAASQPKELWVEPGLDHCGVYFAFREEYARRVLKFFGQYLVEGSQRLEVRDQRSEVSYQP